MTAATDTALAVVQAARDVVAVHRGPGDLSAILDGLDRLDESLKAHDAARPDAAPRALQPDMDMSRWFGWTGCRAELACLHYLLGDRDEPLRATALCRACSKANAKRTRLQAQRGARP